MYADYSCVKCGRTMRVNPIDGEPKKKLKADCFGGSSGEGKQFKAGCAQHSNGVERGTEREFILIDVGDPDEPTPEQVEAAKFLHEQHQAALVADAKKMAEHLAKPEQVKAKAKRKADAAKQARTLLSSELKELAKLRKDGTLTDDEFDAAKGLLLGR